ncbi:Serine/threonine-protein phosphatase 4 catalytic subunit, partial [Corvus brachyrhynchos]
MGELSDLDRQIEQLRRCELIKESEVKALCAKARWVSAPLSTWDSPEPLFWGVFGHFWVLLGFLRLPCPSPVGGDVPETNYLFMGDFVDRGFYSVETFLLLLALKGSDTAGTQLGHSWDTPGTHLGHSWDRWDTAAAAGAEGYLGHTWGYLVAPGDIWGCIFCVHGGLSPSIQTLDQIRTIDRKQEVPHDGPMCDLLWSDPEGTAG